MALYAQDSSTGVTTSPLASFSFPRTGKRGVPQQFPRRLFEMLENETKLMEQNAGNPRVITWSDSGKAFRIVDVNEFATTVLPKYFRTKKFSSFQRNLNLYGFAKVRRGPETDMYAHPSFRRFDPQGLLQLRKVSSSSSAGSPRAKATAAVIQQVTKAAQPTSSSSTRAISPSSLAAAAACPHGINLAVPPVSPLLLGGSGSPTTTATSLWSPPPAPLAPLQQQPNPAVPMVKEPQVMRQEAPVEPDRGRLDLLAFALEQEAFAATS